jgi:hypothetical protein
MFITAQVKLFSGLLAAAGPPQADATNGVGAENFRIKKESVTNVSLVWRPYKKLTICICVSIFFFLIYHRCVMSLLYPQGQPQGNSDRKNWIISGEIIFFPPTLLNSSGLR